MVITMFKTPFFEILSQDNQPEATLFELKLNPDCEVYQGHFPEKAVAPGVCNIQMIRGCAEKMTQCPLFLYAISQCKFTALVTPDATPLLSLRIQLTPLETAGAWKLRASLFHGEQSYLELKAEVKAA